MPLPLIKGPDQEKKLQQLKGRTFNTTLREIASQGRGNRCVGFLPRASVCLDDWLVEECRSLGELEHRRGWDSAHETRMCTDTCSTKADETEWGPQG